MSALAHRLESQGVPTVVIGLVLPQLEKTQPPRALMVPFLLGRPLGEPGDALFQKRVLLQALNLLTRSDGPVLLEHFPDDNPSASDLPDWRPSIDLGPLPAAIDGQAGWPRFEAELAAILPAWECFKRRFERTTVGLSSLDIKDWPGVVAAALAGDWPHTGIHPTPALLMRFLIDDIKALYGEALQADGDSPSVLQMERWFWHQTAAGDMLRLLRSRAMDSPNNGLRTVGGRFFVPAPYVLKCPE